MKTQIGVVICAAILLSLDGSASAQTAPRWQLGKTSDKELAFDHTGKAADGTDLQVDAAEFIFRSPGGAPIRVKIDGPIQAGENRYQVAAVIGGVPDGDYNASVRVRGINGNWSDESLVHEVTISSKKPAAPGNFREVP